MAYSMKVGGQTFSVKGQLVSILVFVGHTAWQQPPTILNELGLAVFQ